MQIRHLPVNECPDGGMDGAARAKAIEHLCVARETTNQKLIDLLNRMYDDIAPKQASVKVMETLVKMDFAGVLPETSKVMMGLVGRFLTINVWRRSHLGD